MRTEPGRGGILVSCPGTRAGQHILTAEDPLPSDLRDVLALIN